MQNFIKKINNVVNPQVFWISNLSVFLLVIFTSLFGETFNLVIEKVLSVVLENVSWLFVVTIFVLLFYMVKIALIYGKVKLGDENDKPEFSNLSWIAMLFSAGLGIGLLYSGTYEPLYHYFNADKISHLNDSKKFLGALDITFFHWGIPAWLIYSSTGLMFAYKFYIQKKPMVFSSYIPEKNYLLRNFVDIFAILSILVGVILTFALGVTQINAGINSMFNFIPINKVVQSVIILVITLAATLSVLSGLNKGIKILSQINMVLAGIVCLAVFLTLSVGQLIGIGIEATGIHISNFIKNLTYTASLVDKSWFSGWTVIYWAWWISWAPFVGLFIARISKGRTIREFLVATILAPTIICIIWFTIFGVAGYESHIAGLIDFKVLVDGAPYQSLFAVLDRTSFSSLFSVVTIFSIFVFYVTSSDSGSYVVDMISSGGRKSPNNGLKVYWSVIEGLLAFVLLYFGGIKLMKSLVIFFSIPLVIYICLGTRALYLNLSKSKS